MPNSHEHPHMQISGFPFVHTNYGKDESSQVIFIGGSTMAGKGISSPAYPELFYEATKLSVSVYTKYLIKLDDVISVIESNDISNVLVFINCGAGDQIRVLNPIFSKMLPGHWSLPAHMEPPVSYSRRTKKRFKQKVTLVVKNLVKNLARIFGLYPNTTQLEIFKVKLQKLALIANQRSLKICWIGTAVGDSRIPLFIRREKVKYCALLFQETLSSFPGGSLYLSLDEIIEPNDLLDDSFHLSSLGHIKMAKLLKDCVK